MLRWIHRVLLTSSLLGLCCIGTVEGAGPNKQTVVKNKSSLFSKSITTTTITAPLFPYDEREPNGTGVAQYTTTTVTTKILGQTFTSSSRTLTVTASGLVEPDGTEVALQLFYIDPTTEFGSASVKSGSASFSFSSQRDDTFPELYEGDHIDVILAGTPPDATFLVHGNFGAPVTTVTTCGR